MTVLFLGLAAVIMFGLPAVGFRKLGQMLDGWEGWKSGE